MKQLIIASFLIGVIAIVDASVALAGFDRWRWNMPLTDVIAQAPDRVILLRSDQYKTKSIMRAYQVRAYIPAMELGGLVWEVRFGFPSGGDGLRAVLLVRDNPATGEFSDMERALISAFGPPIDAKGDYIPQRTWRDLAKGNVIRLLVSNRLLLEYKPIVTGF